MNKLKDTVLLITYSGDRFAVDRVAESLLRRGARIFRLDTDRFPTEIHLSAYISNLGVHHQLEYGEHSLDLKRVKAVWMHRCWQPQLNSELDPCFQQVCTRESKATWDGFWDSLREARWVDDWQKIRDAKNKLRQLRIAQEVGLHIPRTLVTNDPQKVHLFFHELEGKMIAKLLKPLSFGIEVSPFFAHTSLVSKRDLLEAETLRYCPMVFQEQIPKLRELKVVYVAGNFFVGVLDASCYTETTSDWRQGNYRWQPDALPIKIAHRLSLLMAELGLLFGTIDLIKTPDGKYVFLEVNPTGEWGMLERDLGYPISQAIAEALLNHKTSLHF